MKKFTKWFKSLNVTGKILFIVTIFLIIWELVSLIVPDIWTISKAMSMGGRTFLFIPYAWFVLGGHWFFMREKAAGKVAIIFLIINSVGFLIYSSLIMFVPLIDKVSVFLSDHMEIQMATSSRPSRPIRCRHREPL